jgi:hypothetical protein
LAWNLIAQAKHPAIKFDRKSWHSSSARSERVFSHASSHKLTRATYARPAGAQAPAVWIPPNFPLLAALMVALIGVLRTHA